MTGDTWVSLAILVGCALAGWWFFRWDNRMILRDQEKLESLFPLVGYETLAGRPNSHASGLQGSRRPLRDDNNLGGGATTLRDRIAEALLEEDQRRVCKLTTHDIRFMTDAVMRIVNLHIPPLVTSAIHAYADEELMALRFHGGGTAVEQVEDLHRNATQIASYATRHEKWNGGRR